MSFTSLPLKQRNDFQKYYEDQVYTYLVIHKVDKPARRSKKTEDDYKNFEDQQETLKRLETLHYNCYNSPISPDAIDDSIEWIIDDFDSYIIYKIRPTSCTRESRSYYGDPKYYFYEFDVTNKIITLAELWQSFMNDNIQERIFAKVLNHYKYSNTNDDWLSVWSTIKHSAPDIINHLYLTDVIQWLKNTDSCDKQRDEILVEMLQDGDMISTSIYEREYNVQLERMINLHLYKTLLLYTNEKMKNESIELNDNSINLIQLHMDNPDVVELAKIVSPKFHGMKLIIKKTEYCDDGYDSRNSQEEVEVKDANEAKKYIITHFDVDFSELQRDIKDIYIREYDDVEYMFELKGE